LRLISTLNKKGKKGLGVGLKELKLKLFPSWYKAPILIAENIKRRFTKKGGKGKGKWFDKLTNRVKGWIF